MLIITGANNASNSAGTVAGSKVTSYKVGVLLFSIGVAAGAILEGGKLSRAIQGRAIEGNLQGVSIEVIIGVTFAMLVIATTARLPLPITQALYGASLGSAMYTGIPVNWWNVLTVLLSWAATPPLATLIAFVLTIITRRFEFKSVDETLVTYGLLIIGSSFYTAYAMGANTLGLIIGVIGTDLGLIQALLLTMATTILGGILMGERVARTVGEGMASLGPLTGFSSQFGAATVVHLFTQAGIPVSISHSVIGGVIGGGLGKGRLGLGKVILVRLAVLWTLTPIFSIITAWLLHGVILG